MVCTVALSVVMWRAPKSLLRTAPFATLLLLGELLWGANRSARKGGEAASGGGGAAAAGTLEECLDDEGLALYRKLLRDERTPFVHQREC